MDCS